MLKKIATIASLPLFLAAARFLPWERLPSLCVFHQVTGLPCPSCGMTRSVIALTHLNFPRAWQMNLLAVLLVAILGVWWVCSIYELQTGRRTRVLAWASRRSTPLGIGSIIVLFAFGILRVMSLLRP